MDNLSIVTAIRHVISDFQANPERFWNERDIHWSLFHYIKQEETIKEDYPTELIRAEFPTLNKFPKDRGHYDLVILNAKSASKPEVQNMKAQAPWQDYLELIEIDVAIEVKLWLSRLQIEDRAGWDIQKLTEKPNNVQNAYFLNFVQFNSQNKYMMTYYQQLRNYLIAQKKNHKNLDILCVTSDPKIQSSTANWL
ncbi:hypothetical protein ACFLW9_02575 [Chloroflexota bacterium]